MHTPFGTSQDVREGEVPFDCHEDVLGQLSFAIPISKLLFSRHKGWDIRAVDRSDTPVEGVEPRIELNRRV